MNGSRRLGRRDRGFRDGGKCGNFSARLSLPPSGRQKQPETCLEKFVERSELEKLALLARLNVDDAVFDDVSQGISDVLGLVDQLQAVNTEGVEPMAHPLDALQRLRADEVTEANCRELYQAIAPQTENGLYLVPKVIE